MSERKRWIVMITVSVLIALGLGTLIFLQHNKIDERRDQVASLRKKIDKEREIIKQTPDLIKEVIIQRETDVTIKEILSDDEDINNFVRTLRRFEEDSGVSISSIKQQRGSRKKGKEDFDRVGYTLNFDADAFQMMSFMSFVESHSRLMSVTAFKLSANRKSSRGKKNETPRHKVQMDLETYVYAPKSGGKEVKIDHYARKRDLLISEISQRAGALKVETYDFKGQRGRRDPWVDPRIPVSDPGEPQWTIEEQIAVVDDLVVDTEEAKAIFDTLQSESMPLIDEMKARANLEEKLALLEEQIRRLRSENKLTFLPAAKRFDNEVVAVVGLMREGGEFLGADDGISLAALTEAKQAMNRHIERSEFELALDAFDAIEPKLKLAEKDSMKLKPVQDIRELRRLAATVIEFEAIDLAVGGIALYQDRRPVALINGQAVSEGELFGEELLVRNIRKDQIEFAFRGMVLAIPVEAGSNLPQ